MKKILVIVYFLVLAVLSISCGTSEKTKQTETIKTEVKKHEINYSSVYDSVQSFLSKLTIEREIQEFEAIRDSTGKLTPFLKKVTKEKFTSSQEAKTEVKKEAKKQELKTDEKTVVKKENKHKKTEAVKVPWWAWVAFFFSGAAIVYLMLKKLKLI